MLIVLATKGSKYHIVQEARSDFCQGHLLKLCDEGWFADFLHESQLCTNVEGGKKGVSKIDF